MKHWSILALLGLWLASVAAPARGGEPDAQQLLDIVRKQSAQLETLSQRVQQLEAQQARTRQAIVDEIKRTDTLATKMDTVDVGAVAKLASWAEKVKFSGDLRYRHEFFDRDDRRDRNRQRIRARLQMHAKPSDELDVIFRLATGSSPDPVSTNQTLTGGFDKKNVWIDRAYFDWHPETLGGLHVLGGKMKNPFTQPWKQGLLFDTDMNPEGLALAYKTPLSETVKVFAHGGYFWLAENGGGADVSMVAGQAGISLTPAENVEILFGGGYYQFNNVQGNGVLYDPEDSFGNSVLDDEAAELEYAEDFGVAEAFAEVKTQVAGLPLSLHGHYINNTQAGGSDDTGWLAGVKLGKAKKPGQWQVFYNYRRLEADAAIGLLTDSDFMGGGTDGEGHKFGAAVQLTQSTQLAASIFMNDQINGSEEDYDRLQLDFKMKF